MSTNPKPRKPRGVNQHPLTDKQKIKMVYRRMVQSCTDTTHPSYKSYGAKGVYVERGDWANPQAFYEWALTSGYQPGLSIDRLDSNGPYCIANVRWADRKMQQRNMCTNVLFDYYGVDLTAGEILELHQGSYTNVETARLISRLHMGWELERAIETPRENKGRTPASVSRRACYPYQGQLYKAKALLVAVHGSATDLELTRFLTRMSRGWTLEEALKPFNQRRGRK